MASKTPLTGLASPIASADGPQLGYIWLDEDHTLRPILGLPGASQIGRSVVPANVYTTGVTSASSGISVLQAADGTFDVMSLPSGSPSSLGMTLPVGAKIALSPSATFALIYTPGAASASLVTGLQSTPTVQSVQAKFPIADSAISDAEAIAFVSRQGSSLSITITPPGGRSVAVAAVRGAGGMAFIPGRDDLLFADAAANTLTLVRNASTTPSISSITAPGLLKAPSAIGVSNSGRWALVANRGSQSVVRIDLASLSGVSISCSCKPTVAEPLADDGTFRVTALASAPNWLVDASRSNPRVLFIPASRRSPESAGIASAVQP